MSMASRRKIACCLRAAAAWVVGSAALFSSAVLADDATPTTVAPNQSISLTDPGTGIDGAGEASVPTMPASQGTPVDLQGDAGTESSTSPSSVASTLMRRRGAKGSLAGEPTSSGLSVPWYRSGLVSLGVVLGVIGAIYWLTRKFVPTLGSSDSSVVRVVARSALSPKHNVALLRVGRRFVLVGLSGERMSTLAEITDEEEVAELVTTTGSRSNSGADTFENLMTREADAFDVDHRDSTVDTDPVVPGRRVGIHGNALTQLKDRLRGLQRKP